MLVSTSEGNFFLLRLCHVRFEHSKEIRTPRGEDHSVCVENFALDNESYVTQVTVTSQVVHNQVTLLQFHSKSSILEGFRNY